MSEPGTVSASWVSINGLLLYLHLPEPGTVLTFWLFINGISWYVRKSWSEPGTVRAHWLSINCLWAFGALSDPGTVVPCINEIISFIGLAVVLNGGLTSKTMYFYAFTRQCLGRSQFDPVSFIQSLGQGSSLPSLACAGEGQSDRLWCQFLGCRWLLGCLSAPTWRIPGLPVRAASYSSGLSLDLT